MTWKPDSVKDWIALASVIFAFGVGWAQIGALKDADAEQERIDARQDKEREDLRKEIREDLKEINRKLDMLMRR